MGYSGAHIYDEHVPYFNEACTWAIDNNVDAFVIVTHWHQNGMGCVSLICLLLHYFLTSINRKLT